MTDPFRGTLLEFCDVLGAPETVFAWWPVRCFDGRVVWGKLVSRRLCLLKSHLQGPGEPWWQYARLIADEEATQ